MNPSTKVFATLALSAALGHKIKTQSTDKTLVSLAEELHKSGFEATSKYPYTALTVSKTVQILNAVGSLLSSPLKPQETLSMLIAGLVDVQAKVKNERKDLIEPVIHCAQACLDSFDEEPDHVAAWER